MRTLITWTDRGVGALAHHVRRPGDTGPVLRLLAHVPAYDRVWILTSTASLPGARQLADEIGPSARLRWVDLEDPSSHAELFRVLEPLADDLRGESVDVLLSAGTPQAQTLWVVLMQAGLLEGRMLQVIPKRFVPVPHPHPVREVSLAIDGFPEIRALRAEVARLRAHIEPTGLVGAALEPVIRRMRRVAPSEVSVWIAGETGTGKELLARALHAASKRAEGPFVAVNAGAFAESVLSSELFGHEKGAFTGAVRAHRGVFEQAHGGTLFLDEVGELPANVQVQLLRVLETGEIRRLGAEGTRTVDVRMVCATHEDLLEASTTGGFRQDLYYRLVGAELRLAPLRERPGDLEELVHHFLRGRRRLDPSVWPALRRHAWPGNVRELRAEIERWVWLTDDVVTRDDLSIHRERRVPDAVAGAPRTLAEQVDEVERAAIHAALDRHQGNRSAASRELGIDRNTLKRKLSRWSNGA